MDLNSYLVLPLELDNSEEIESGLTPNKEKEIVVVDYAINPFQIESFYPSKDTETDEELTVIHTKSGDCKTLKITLAQFKKLYKEKCS